MMQRIMVTTDFSELADQAIGPAAVLASKMQARLILVHVLGGERPPEPVPNVQHYKTAKRLWEADQELEAQALASVEERARKLDGIEWKAIVGRGNPIKSILGIAKAEQVDMIVVSSLGRTGLRRFILGSVAEELARVSPLPVLIWKEPIE